MRAGAPSGCPSMIEATFTGQRVTTPLSQADPSIADTGVMAPTIEVRGVSRSFGATVALDALDLEVDAGEVVALLGPNGAGKTTTIRVLNGVLRPDAGSSRVLGLDPATEGDAVRRRTGVLTENSGLDDR